jgi:hypothetical protein
MRKVTPNTVVRLGNRVLLQLPQGPVATIDLDDYEKVQHLRWQVGPRGHVVAHHGRTTIQLFRFVLGIAPGDKVRVLARNGDLLDARRQNLRVIPWPPSAEPLHVNE